MQSTLHTIWLGAAALLVLALLLVWRLGTWVTERVTEPVRAAGAVASRVAGGDLSVTVVTHRTGSSEVGDLLSSVHSMVVALRRLVGAIRGAADEAAGKSGGSARIRAFRSPSRDRALAAGTSRKGAASDAATRTAHATSHARGGPHD